MHLTGLVVSEADSAVIEGAEVYVVAGGIGFERSTLTDSEGRYTFVWEARCLRGHYFTNMVFDVSASGYDGARWNYELMCIDEPQVHDFVLRPIEG